jgi:D-beta-D-heptose 7-phosphate kinase/D-beta-D-heptose 1-phosphate adenosyltransferase
MTEQNIQPHKKFKILLLGDNCIDVYQYGTVDRISPEAPIPVFKLAHKEERPGMAANVAANLLNLGCSVNFTQGAPSTKTRLIDVRSKQQIVRIDNDVQADAIQLTGQLAPCDAIVISDYNKGAITYELIEELRSKFSGPIFIDTKKTDLARLEGCFIKINELEYSRVTSLPSGVPSGLVVTLGDRGAMYNGVTYPSKEVEVADVTGAGDTFLAALAYCYIDTNDIVQSIQFAIQASSVTVQHIGVHAPTLKEMG